MFNAKAALRRLALIPTYTEIKELTDGDLEKYDVDISGYPSQWPVGPDGQPVPPEPKPPIDPSKLLRRQRWGW